MTTSPALGNQRLGAREITDVLHIDFSLPLGSAAGGLSVITTLAYALKQAGAELLQLDSREIGVMVIPSVKVDCTGGFAI